MSRRQSISDSVTVARSRMVQHRRVQDFRTPDVRHQETANLTMPKTDSRSTKKGTELTLIDKLSRLSYHQTLKLLGKDAPRLLRAGDKWDFRIEEDVYLGPGSHPL